MNQRADLLYGHRASNGAVFCSHCTVFLPLRQIDNEAFEDLIVFAYDDIAIRVETDIREALSEYFMS